MKENLQDILSSLCHEEFNAEVSIELTRPDPEFGDYSTSIAMKLAKELGKSPKDIAQLLAEKLRNQANNFVSEVTVAGPGFINITLNDNWLIDESKDSYNKNYQDQQIIVEFGDPNPFKELHLGHLYTSVVGDTIARLFEASGGDVKKLSYHGDVGMHIAKAIWAIKQKLDQDENLSLDELLNSDTAIGAFYAEGNQAYESSEDKMAAIKLINASVYSRDNEEINEIYDRGKELSFNKFNAVFDELGITFYKRYMESESAAAGISLVNDNTPAVFEESEGAIVYKGEKVGLHTRVFINSQGLPTYEAKDLGLTILKDKDFPDATRSIIITDYQQAEYFKVMLAALNEINPAVSKKTTHIAHGQLGLSTGKMSSRTGKVFAGSELIAEVKLAIVQQFGETPITHDIFLAALRYTFLKARIGSDIVFDVKESVALEGNSGPYIQYAHARARSILAKADETEYSLEPGFESEERRLLGKINEYPEVVERSIEDLLPHHICTYLYELAQVFNSFYEHNRVIGSDREKERLTLVKLYADVLKQGLGLLGVPAPDKM